MEIEELKQNITKAKQQLAIMMNADDCVRIEAGMKEACEYLTAYIYLRKYISLNEHGKQCIISIQIPT